MEPETQRQIDEIKARHHQPRPHQPPIKQARPRVQRDPFAAKTAAQQVGIGMGVLLIIYGMAGFVAPTLWGAHLGVYHNIFHVVVGLVSIWYGVERSATAAKTCCRAFGSLFMALGIVGLLVAGGNADSLWVIVPNALQMGTTDHLIHIVVGGVFLLGAFFTLRKKDIVYH